MSCSCYCCWWWWWWYTVEIWSGQSITSDILIPIDLLSAMIQTWHLDKTSVLQQLTIFFQAIILNKIMYALPVYFGYLTDRQKHQLQQISDTAKRRSLTLHYMITALRSWQKKLSIIILFHNSCSENHCLRHIYTVNEKPGAMRLRATFARGMILRFPSLNTILIKRILLSEPCTHVFWFVIRFHNMF